jgi:multidrug efflux pump subunit AcrB
MGITEFFVHRKVVTYFIVALLFLGGTVSYTQLGKLEDPDFTVKTAVVVTGYPGADPEEVELEVTDRIEKAIQELPQLEDIESVSIPGVSIITVDIRQEYWSDRLPQVWDEMRKKIRDITPQLPPGAGPPDVGDDFSFVYGFVLAVTGDGFSYRELEDYADDIKKELSVVDGVARVELWGVQEKVVYLDIEETQFSQLGITRESIVRTLQYQNAVVDAGSLDIDSRRMRVAPSGEFSSPGEIGELAIRPSPVGIAGADRILALEPRFAASGATERSAELIRIKDLATVREGYREPPATMMRYNGDPAIGIAIANIAGGNILRTGDNLDRRIEELMENLPVGIELHRVAWQSGLVELSINDFMISLIEAVAIVLVVLVIPSGLRMGVIVGSMVIFIILGTFIFMSITSTDLHRISLGALVVALGMMVDNSCFVSDSMAVKMQSGMDRVEAAIESGKRLGWPLLGATVIASVSFYPIFASTANAGEYCRALFTVVAASLLISWFIALSVTPVMCVDILRSPGPGAGARDPFDTPFFRRLRRVATFCIGHRLVTLGVCGGLLASAILSWGNVRQMFFPDSTRNQLMIDYWAPEGARIQETSEAVKAIEEKLLRDERISAVSTFIGAGPPRFYLPVDPQGQNPSYAQIVITAGDFKQIREIAAEFEPWSQENVPEAMVRTRKYGVGPSETWPLEARISGPSSADLSVLRRLGDEGMAILHNSPYARDIRTEMRNPVQKLVPQYSQERGRWATIDRQDIAAATRRAFDGLTVGLYREGDDLYPIIVRNVEPERQTLADTLDALQIQPQLYTRTIPLGQVTDGIDVVWEDPIVHRWQRRRAVTVQGAPKSGVTFPTLVADVRDEFEALDMPPGYEIFWDGEYESTVKAQSSLVPGMIPAAVIIALIIVLLYNSIRVLLCILLVVPFAAIGIVYGLWVLDSPMGFVAILGVLSLTGMMIKNMIVMTDAITLGVADGMDPFDACVSASVTQARPIMLAAGTTVLGVVPLLPDPFWSAMAACIMAGLGVGATLTIMLYPTLYATLHGIRRPEAATGPVPEDR